MEEGDHHQRAPLVESGRLHSWTGGLVHVLCCAGLCVALTWLGVFVLECVALHRADTRLVHDACAGLWDFMLVSLLSPLAVPLAYCLSACLVGILDWRTFSGVAMLILSVSSLYMALTAASSHACVEAVRLATPPVPWLIILGWFKAVAFGAGALAALRSRA